MMMIMMMVTIHSCGDGQQCAESGGGFVARALSHSQCFTSVKEEGRGPFFLRFIGWRGTFFFVL